MYKVQPYRKTGETMLKPVIDLEKILTKELELYARLYSLENAKSEAIIEREGKLIESLSIEQESLLSDLSRLEMKREAVIDEYANSNDLRDFSGALTLRDIVLSMDEDSSHHLLRLGMELKNSVVELSRLQKTNEQLIRDNLEFFDILLSGLREENSLSAGYGNNGKEDSRVASSMIFNQKV